MSPRRILAILTKDLRDAWRDGRIIVLLLMPVGIALIPSLGGEDERPTTQVAIVDAGEGDLARELGTAAGKGVEIELTPTRDAASARRLVAGDEIEFAVLVAPTAQEGPARAEILVAEDASPAAQSVIALVPDALARAAGRSPAAQTQVRTIAPEEQAPAIEIVSPRAVTLVFASIVLMAFVAMMVVPIQTAEELETGTFAALRLAASGPEILAAKAFAGFLYGSAGIGLMVLLTGVDVHDPLLFYGAALSDPGCPAVQPGGQAARRRSLAADAVRRGPGRMAGDRHLGARGLCRPGADRVPPGYLTASRPGYNPAGCRTV